MKRHATTLILLVLTIGLAVWLWRDRNHVTAQERQDRSQSVFPAWRREDLSRIEIAHEGETIVLTRDPKQDTPWRLASDERADQAAVERLATTLELATIVRKVGAGDNLGFAKPRAVGAVTMGELVFRFALGGPSPRPEGSAYLRVDDGEPFVVSKELTDALLASVDAYRDRTVIPYLSVEMARFEATHPGGGFVVQRRDDRSFDVPALGVLASRTALDNVWSALAEMRAESFPKDADADRLTQSPRLTILIAPKDASKPPGELVVGDACPGHPDDVVVLRRRPTRVAACAPRGAMDALVDITPAMLVDRHLFAFRHDEIEEVKLEEGANVLELARRGNGFHERAPADRELDSDEAEAASDELVAIEKTEASDVKAGGGAPFAAKYRAHVWSSEIEEVVEVGALDQDRVAVRRVRDDARMTLTPVEARRLVPRATWFRPLTLLADSRRVTRVLLRCGTSQELVDDGEGLRLVEPSGYETDGSITQLVDGLTRGKVVAWAADRDDGSFGISEDGCRVVLSFADGNAPATVLFGRAVGDESGSFGRVDGHAEVFIASPALVSLAQRIYVSRGVLRADPAEVAHLDVTVGGKRVAGNVDALGALYADRVIALTGELGGPVDVELAISLADAGAPRRVRCTAAAKGVRRCVNPAVKAVFEVSAAAVDRVLAPPVADAGLVDAR